MIYIEERTPVKCPGLSSLFVRFDFNKLIVDELKLLENVFFNPETKEWEIPITNLSSFLDRCCLIDSIQIKVLPTVVEEQIPTLYNKNEFQTLPFDYQMDGIHYGVTHDSWLLLDAPGLGKTLQIIYIAQKLKEERGLEHCLIICGLNTLKFNWKKEIEKHSNLSCRILGQRINRKGRLVIDGIPERLKQLQNPIEEFFVIVNVETLRDENIIKAFCKNKFNKFDMMVFDEIHVCVSPYSLIDTDRGMYTIQDIVQDQISCKVKSYDTTTKSVVYKNVVDYHKTKTRKPMLHLEIEENGTIKSLDCTVDHQVYTSNRGFVPAMFLTEEDNIIIDF